MERSLVPVADVAADLRYALQGLPGVPAQPWLESETAERLSRAQQWLAPQGYQLLIWDPWRSRVTQQAISDRYHDELVRSGMDSDTAREAVREFVASPAGVYPHGTGGVVDLTLCRDDQPQDCGTDFDEFSPRAHREWFTTHRPETAIDLQAAYRRLLLQQAMEHAGFVGLPHEWWHFEFGTRMWARHTGQEPFLTGVLEPQLRA